MSISDSQQRQLREWLAAVARHDADAFRSLYGATSSKLFGFALRILTRREWAEEALQESFISIWNSAVTYQFNFAAPMTWMAAIVRNKAFDILRRVDDSMQLGADSLDPEILSAVESPDPTPIEALQMSSSAKALARCLARLEATHRQAVALAFYHELSYSDVARQMNIPIGTIKTWIRRGLEQLRLCMNGLEHA
ncbi:sigma-70 family RNA polymerase sigma factor [Noviherbaspirillum malthae]|uniref:sigma-70 family RNA polymerase sigma factor n=1 Tax=Noviherbaspirillum malthae TaxID=1260987 RepID=UPI00188EEF7C|nr:sigma-70 family RNA polymerase sigma factor [Noviherbaspirillum malthae]